MHRSSQLYRSLASLHRAGLPWPEALRVAAPGKYPAAQAALEAGRPLSEAFAGGIPGLHRALLRAGEQSGTLEQVLERLAERDEEEARSRGERRAALVYPVVLAHIAALLLPLPDLLQGRPLDGLIWSVAVLLPVYLYLWLARPQANRLHAPERMPKARGARRSLIEESDAAALLALADVLDAGVALSEGLELAQQAGADGRAAYDLRRAQSALNEGRSLSDSFCALPEATRSALRAAEHAGELPAAARRAASSLSFGVSMRRKRQAAILPIVMILLIGGVIGFRIIRFYSQALSPLTRGGH